MTSEVYKLRKVDGEKQKRINSFKMKLEEKDKIDNDGILRQKNERIHTLEEKYDIKSYDINFRRMISC